MSNQLPIKAHYAALAMLALADQHSSGDPLPARVIAEQQGIPCQFLTQILQQLRSAGLVSSTRGASGGFVLERAPSRITLADVVDVICPSPGSEPEFRAGDSLSDTLQSVWDELQSKQRQILEGLSLSDLLERHRKDDVMFYI
ncbi:MAG: Rrf2 family transcriptional regulator [Planctomycetota bacterium]